MTYVLYFTKNGLREGGACGYTLCKAMISDLDIVIRNEGGCQTAAGSVEPLKILGDCQPRKSLEWRQQYIRGRVLF